MTDRFTPEVLQQALAALPVSNRYRVAFSGGLDSLVLLHALVRLGATTRVDWKISALHVNHGLQPEAAQWAEFCRRTCQAFDVPLELVCIDACPWPGQSAEEAAREARYTALANHMAEGDAVLTAHHMNDQAETLLLRLLRGAGPAGAAAIPEQRRLGKGWVLRPLLGVTRRALRDYGIDHQLHWIEDPSNRDLDFDRNYLRHEVMPRLSFRWPSAAQTLARSARLNQEAAAILRDMAQQDLTRVVEPSGVVEPPRIVKPLNIMEPRGAALNLGRLQELSTGRQKNMVRFWLSEQGLPIPQERHLDALLDQVVTAGGDRVPLLQWPGAEVRRYRDHLYALPPLAPHDPSQVWNWDTSLPLQLPALGLSLSREHLERAGLWVPAAAQVRVGFRRGGERIKLTGRAGTRALKKLLQEARVPPWQRDRLPIITIEGELAAVLNDRGEPTLVNEKYVLRTST
jgi:tRNA(Ile)-lysidine synthase